MPWGKPPSIKLEDFPPAQLDELAATEARFLTDVCEELFGSFLRHRGGKLYMCALCDAAIPIDSWIHAEHARDCIIPKVREHLKCHRPACVPEPATADSGSATEAS